MMRVFSPLFLSMLPLLPFVYACGEDPKPTPPLVIDLPDEGVDQAPDLVEDMAADLGEDQQPDLLEDMAPDLVEDMAPDMTISGACPTSLTWRQGPPLPGAARDHHATFITTQGGPKLHVVGGTNYQGVFADHWAAPIMEDGSLGAWVEEAALPFGAAGQGVAQVGDEVVLLSGQRAGGFIKDVWRAERGADGVITGWQALEPLPQARFHSSAAVDGRTIYVSGGIRSDGVAQASLFRATLGEDGVLGAWEELALPKARSHHSSVVWQGALYTLLGFEGNPFNNRTTDHLDVMRAEVGPQGLGEWTTVASAGEGLSTHATTVVDGCALTLGGLQIKNNLPSYKNGVLALDLAAQTVLGEQISAFLTGRSHMHQAPHHSGHLYIVGGSKAYHDVVNSVEIGTLIYPD